MNKTTKIALNYGLGILITAVLLWSLYSQVSTQFKDINQLTLWPADAWQYLIISLLLIPVNLGIEARKWQLLAATAFPITYAQAVKSLLGGIAFSIITPNRIGEYPGRILFLDKNNSSRLISVSVLGGCSQLLAILVFGTLGLVYYTAVNPGYIAFICLSGNLLLTVAVWLFYWRFERWAPYLERLRWLRKIRMYGHLLTRFSSAQQIKILLLAMLRFSVFTLQFYCMLRWMQVPVPFFSGFFLSALFFWAMAIIPSVALAELGIRGKVSLFLFSAFSAHSIGILTASIGLWFINLVIPALIGSILLLRLKLVR